MAAETHLFWDSCVFIRCLTGNPPGFLSDIKTHLKDAKAGKTLIHRDGS